MALGRKPSSIADALDPLARLGGHPPGIVERLGRGGDADAGREGHVVNANALNLCRLLFH